MSGFEDVFVAHTTDPMPEMFSEIEESGLPAAAAVIVARRFTLTTKACFEQRILMVGMIFGWIIKAMRKMRWQLKQC